MEEILKKLRDNLYQQAKLYEKLSELAKEKQKALIHSELSEIDRTTKLEEKLILDAGLLEQERLKWSEQIGKTMGKPAEELTLSELVDRFPELQDVQVYLEKVIHQLKEIHEVNTELLKQAIQIVNFTVDLLAKTEETTYGKTGNEVNQSKQLHFLDKSV